jgi:hypothetical protein
MKRLLRILFNALTAISLLLFVATIVLWVRSHWVCDTLTQMERRQSPSMTHGLCLYSECGRMGSAIFDSTPMLIRDTPGDSVPLNSPSVTREDWTWVTTPSHPGGGWAPWSSLRYGVGIGGTYNAVHRRDVAHWLIAALLAAVPAARLVAPIRRALRRPGPNNLCPACGYDLRATPNRCPECGVAPAAVPL